MIPRVLLALALLMLPSGCGYRWGTTYNTDIRTVAVPIFDNPTFVSDIDAELADALAKRIQSKTPWRVTSADNADTTLTGAFRRTGLNTLSVTPETGLVQEQSISYAVDFEWRDNRTGEVLVERRNFQAATTFLPSRGEDGTPGERVELGSRAAIDELAERIVAELRSSW